MTARVFRTRRAIITLTDTMLIYELRRDPHQRVSVARADITEVHLVTRRYWFARAWTEVIVRHHGGVLTIPHVGHRTAVRLRAALGF
jgi:hypothetical protein